MQGDSLYLVVFFFIMCVEHREEEDILEGLGMEGIIWSNGSSRRSKCSLEGVNYEEEEKVPWMEMVFEVWDGIGKVGKTIGFGGKSKGACWSGIGKGHS